MPVVVTLTNHIPDFLLQWDDEIQQILDTTADKVLAEAQHRAPVKTGYMRDSGRIEPGEDRYSRYIHFTAPYSYFVHDGTRFMAARPYLRQAAEHERLPYQEAFSALGKLHTL